MTTTLTGLRHEMVEGERVEGVVLRLPAPGVPSGTRLFLETATGPIAIAATAKKGATVLERRLRDEAVGVGDTITVSYFGMRRTADGERSYRDFRLEVKA